ncbi:MAG: hypothetical protein QG657_2281 [Acidobacteriota bacterium]|nr:hypothetical protein [Acidobacteriota bacterium]
MAHKRASIGNLLETSQLMFQNARDDEEINTLLAPFKVTEQQFDFGLSLCRKAFKLESLQIKLHGQQFRSRKKFDKLFNEFNETYQMHLKFLRISFEKDKEKLKELSAFGKRSRSIADWIKQAFSFYQTTVVDEEAMTALDNFGITAEMFQQNEGKIKEVDDAFRTHKIKLGAAQNAVEERNAVFKELDTFAKHFRAICRTALKAHPQLLEKLGIKVYSKGYKKRKRKKDKNQPPTTNSAEQSAPNTAESV